MGCAGEKVKHLAIHYFEVHERYTDRHSDFIELTFQASTLRQSKVTEL